MKFRFHRGSLDESLATTVEVDSLLELRRIIEKEWQLGDESLSIESYGYDERIGWDTHIVLWKNSPVGFLDGPLTRKVPQQAKD